MTTNIELPTVASILVAPRVPIFDPDWTADEEIALLEALKNYGFANWGAVSNDIRGKTPAQCAEHYQAAYLGIGEYSSEESISAPMEKNAIDFALLESFLKDELDLSGMKLQLAMRQEQRAAADADETSDGADTPSAAPSRRRQSIGRPPKAKAQATIPPELQSDIAGFMPLRRDFDVEHDNDAELVIADMKFAEDESPEETELKLKMLEIYNRKLDDRQRRKDFVIERGLLDFKKVQATERRRAKEEREVYNQFRPFARFLSADEHEHLIQGIILEQQLQRRVEQLQKYRKLGLRTLAEVEEYEAAERRQEREAQSAKQRQEASYLYAAGTPKATGDRSSRYLSRGAGSEPDTDNLSVADSTTSSRRNKRKFQAEDTPADESSATARTAESAEAAGGGDAANTITVKKQKFSLAGCPGVELLTTDERELCEHLQLLPSQYVTIKTAIISESVRTGIIRRNEVGQLVRVDVARSKDVYDFIVSCGWVKADKVVRDHLGGPQLEAPELPKPPGWSPTKLPEPQTQPTADTTVAESTADSNLGSESGAPASSDAAVTLATKPESQPQAPNSQPADMEISAPPLSEGTEGPNTPSSGPKRKSPKRRQGTPNSKVSPRRRSTRSPGGR